MRAAVGRGVPASVRDIQDQRPSLSWDWFQQPNVWRGLLDNSPGLQPIEDDLQVLDPASWAVFHVKAARLVHLMDKWGYSRALFDCFNEIKGYRYLVQAGYRDVRFVPEQQETQTPDLRARSEESTVLMEVKTINERRKHKGPCAYRADSEAYNIS